MSTPTTMLTSINWAISTKAIKYKGATKDDKQKLEGSSEHAKSDFIASFNIKSFLF